MKTWAAIQMEVKVTVEDQKALCKGNLVFEGQADSRGPEAK